MIDSFTDLDMDWTAPQPEQAKYTEALTLSINERACAVRSPYRVNGSLVDNFKWLDFHYMYRLETVLDVLAGQNGGYVDSFDMSGNWDDDERGWDWGPKGIRYPYTILDNEPTYPWGWPGGTTSPERKSYPELVARELGHDSIEKLYQSWYYTGAWSFKPGSRMYGAMQKWMIQQYTKINNLKYFLVSNNGGNAYSKTWENGVPGPWTDSGGSDARAEGPAVGASEQDGQRYYTDIAIDITTELDVPATADVYALLTSMDSVSYPTGWSELSLSGVQHRRAWKKLASDLTVSMNQMGQVLIPEFGKIETIPGTGVYWETDNIVAVVKPQFKFRNW